MIEANVVATRLNHAALEYTESTKVGKGINGLHHLIPAASIIYYPFDNIIFKIREILL